jgi:phosphate ABC transporter phosphate-binding protein
MIGRRSVPAVLVAGLIALQSTVGAGAADAESYVSVSGAGSTWSQVAVDAWRTDVAKNGLTVNYSGTGSTDGRQQYIFGTADFAVSEIPFQLDPKDGSTPENPKRPWAYLPIVAGGTSFMYHLTVGGKRVTDLRLSGETITKIFTGRITNWNDPAITKDYGKQLPSMTIQPVVRSDGSGTSAQFTLYMATKYPSIWNDFCEQYAAMPPPCGQTSFYPQFPGSTAQAGSNGVANFVAASYGEGAITYVEYAYALRLGFPVAKVLNSAGYYTSPTAANVAVALTGAKIAADLTQDLRGVYDNPDKRTYPLSSYSYMIVPTTTDQPFNEDKGKSLSTFVNYFLCAGQQKAEVLGYSPLPKNLVESGFDQVRKIPGFVEPPSGDLSSCHNPTFEGGVNVLLRDAPYPPECDKVTSPPCGSTAAPLTQPTGVPSGGGSSTGTGSGAGTGTTSGQQTGQPAGGVVVDPETGQIVEASGDDAGSAQATVQTLGAFRASSGQTKMIYGLTALELLLVVAAPPAIALLLRRRSRRTELVE